MPLDVAAVIRDEAQLRRCRETVERELIESRQRLRRFRRSHSWWRYLAQASYRRERHRTRVTEEQTQHQLLTLLRQLKALQRRLSPTLTLRATLAQQLGEHEPLYRRGLRAARYHEHWRRQHTLVRDRLGVLSKLVQRVIAMLREDASLLRRRFSRETQHALEVAGAAALEVEHHVGALNEVSRHHRQMVQDTPFEDVSLPRLQGWNCASWFDRLANEAPASAVETLEKFVAPCTQDWPSSLSTIDVLFRDATSLHSSLAEKYLDDALDAMVTQAERFWIEDRDVRTVMEDIENRLTEAERARWVHEVARNPDSLGR